MLNLVFFESAELDMLNIKNYLGSDYGLNFILDLKLELYNLCEFPNLGSDISDNFKKYIFNRKYYVYYLLTSSDLIIVNVVSIKQGSYVERVLMNLMNFK